MTLMEERSMGLAAMVERVKARPDYNRVGMIVCHNGVVRGSSRDGKPVAGLDVEVDRRRLTEILVEMKSRKGIIDVLAEVYEGSLNVGDDIMNVVIAGDIRDNTFPVLTELINAIKRQVVVEKEK